MNNYICQLNENVERIHVRYNNRYGIALAGDLYAAKNMDKSKKYPAIVVGAPYGGVKEQGPSVYANELANRGFVVLTFDHAIWVNQEGNLVMYHRPICSVRISVQVWIFSDFKAMLTVK